MWNGIWYILLSALSIGLFGYAFFKAQNPKLLVYLFSLAGLIYTFETVVAVFFRGYVFKPHLLMNAYLDNVVGAIISDLLIVPSASVILSVFQLGFGSMLLVSAGLMAVEEWFKKLYVYEQFWWKTAYTGVFLPVVFLIGRRLWGRMEQRIPDRLGRFVIVYFCHISLHSSLLFPFAVMNAFSFHIGWFSNPYRDWIAFGMTYRCLFYSPAAAFAVINRRDPVRLVSGYLAMIGADALLAGGGILRLAGPAVTIVLLVADAAALAVLVWFDRLLCSKREEAAG